MFGREVAPDRDGLSRLMVASSVDALLFLAQPAALRTFAEITFLIEESSFLPEGISRKREVVVVAAASEVVFGLSPLAHPEVDHHGHARDHDDEERHQDL